MNKTLLCLVVVVFSANVFADSNKPTCKEEPTRRDCVRLEDPNTTPPKQTVDKKEPSRPVARPVPSSDHGAGGRGKGK